MRKNYERALKALQDEVLVMASMVEKSIKRSIEALKNRDLELARQIIADDEAINNKRFDIEEQCVELIATQQPMAVDLRIIIAILNMLVDLERIGDHSEGIAKIAIMVGDEPPIKPLIDLPRMAEKSCQMLSEAMDAFINRDVVLAKKICDDDEEVDALYEQVFRELLIIMAENPKTIKRATRLIWVAHNLERSADRITNICERVVFIATGHMEDIGASKY
ncbi:MAG: phosphate signaling complex protein PhoU [Dehalococcoidales bacterium]|jgi:phosphate transport system protein|nr:phosphate signaling complex protein PhoU [Dehalococcoidales bacterium]MDD4322911.1 phosphate signaling complex protein PhoU [Dehalococcoidales bacterium]MDD4794631.1 phosphate signaling complex protein PhoU [Dehalococcoidales bacterium]MDD5122032.1 phosphate signaling complex protein PhoU [Dehalococcoidales bacterium]MDD5498457.1 phosphate signaling complex protein PhoU [Dehalococcoidales bacterium]